MPMLETRKRSVAAALVLLILLEHSPRYSYQDLGVPRPVKLSSRLQKLFSKTKLLCFGRYALQVPLEAQIIWGEIWFPSTLHVISGGPDAMKRRVAEDIKKKKFEEPTTEIAYDKEGPVDGSWQVRYYDSAWAKKYEFYFFDTYVNKGDLTFILGGGIDPGQTEEMAAAREAKRARTLRLRAPDEVPNEPGFCIEHAFMPEAQYSGQEMVSAGFYLPSLPDVTFSISSNKDAYGDYTPENFEKEERAKLSLLARIEEAKKEQGFFYPSRNLLREGKRDVQHWHGEESLIKRLNGVHDFEWALVGTPRDVANPSEFDVQMYTKVQDDTVGAAKTASLSDDEAVALWDKLLSGLKFRVKVPGAPEGSYFIPPRKTATAATGK